ncbi:MAG: Na+/H+ antiporter NhaC family protein [Pseudomonadota bacterium]
MPPILAIAIALATRAVIPALIVGIWSGVFLIDGPGVVSIWTSLLAFFDTYLVAAIADSDRVRVLLFTMMLGGLIGIIAANGGLRSFVEHVTRYASTARRGQLATAGLGLAIFFDDIANTLLIGKTMRPVADRLRISREKLAYLVDSTAAPIAGIAFASTWVGYEVSVIESTVAGIADLDTPAYLIFLDAIPYSFYSILTLFMVFAVAWSGRDFGPMHEAERLARAQVPVAEVTPAADEPTRGNASNALVPLAVCVVTLFASLLITGSGDSFREIIGSADSYAALLWASLLGVLSACLITVWHRQLSLDAVMDAWVDGVRSTVYAVVILVLSWTLADVVKVLDTATFIIDSTRNALPIFLLPALSFLLGGVVAFSTGTSWGTMGVLMPLMLPLAWTLLTDQAAAGGPMELYIFHGAVAGVLAGAIWGDHCSPISDTTVLSSLATECVHIEHVRTQIPYAMTSGGCALLLCAIPVGLGVPWWLCLLVSGAAILLILRWLGRPA